MWNFNQLSDSLYPKVDEKQFCHWLSNADLDLIKNDLFFGIILVDIFSTGVLPIHFVFYIVFFPTSVWYEDVL